MSELARLADFVRFYERTFDEWREQPRPCPCGRHLVTGQWSYLYCPFAEPHRGLWAQPEVQPCCE